MLLKKILPVVSEKTAFDLLNSNLPLKNERRSEILDASTNSLNKLISYQMQRVGHNNKQLQFSSTNSKSSGDLLSNNGVTIEQRYEKLNSGFFTLHSKKLNEPIKQNYGLKSNNNKIPISNDRAHSCHNLLVYKNATLLNDNQRKNLYQKVDNSIISLQKVEPAPNLPIRHQNLSFYDSYKIDDNHIFKSEKKIFDTETDYDSLSSIKLLNKISKEFSDYSEFISESKINKKNNSILIDQQKNKQIVNNIIAKENETNKINKKLNNEIYSDLNNLTKQKPPIIQPKPLQISPKKVINNPNQILQNFCDYLLTTNLRKIAFLITEEDNKMFCLEQKVSSLKKIVLIIFINHKKIFFD